MKIFNCFFKCKNIQNHIKNVIVCHIPTLEARVLGYKQSWEWIPKNEDEKLYINIDSYNGINSSQYIKFPKKLKNKFEIINKGSCGFNPPVDHSEKECIQAIPPCEPKWQLIIHSPDFPKEVANVEIGDDNQ